jgi:hypothetical protein
MIVAAAKHRLGKAPLGKTPDWRRLMGRGIC